MTWTAVYDRASAHDVSLEDIRTTLAERRDERTDE